MTRIWMNHWFSTAYNIINLIKQDEPGFVIIGSNANEDSPIHAVCDEWYSEPRLDEDAYVEYCLDFCLTHRIDLFLPRRRFLAVSKNKARFESQGVKVLVDDYNKIKPLNNKVSAYEHLHRRGIGIIPEYELVTDGEHFAEAVKKLSSNYSKVCFKFVSDEGGKSYRLIDDHSTGYDSLFKKQTTRISLDAAVEALSEKRKFPQLMVMPYLPGKEISVDCLKTNTGIIMIPRYKDTSRIETIHYDQDILNTCEQIINEFALEMPCNIQFKYLDGIPYFLEVNTRMSGGIQMSCAGAGINIPNIAVNKLLGISKPWEDHREEKFVTHIEIPLVL